MRRVTFSIMLILSLLLLGSTNAFPWGADAHVLITQKAIQILPDEMAGLFNANVEELSRLCNVPDNEWKADPELANRSNWHFLDIDLFDYGYPFKDFPRDREAAKKLYEESDKEAGYLPWTVADYYTRLVEAFRLGDKAAIVESAGLMSHFAGDSTMPLHTTRNYNGKYSGNLYYRAEWDTPEYLDKGVHQRFELGLVTEYLEGFTREVEPTTEDLKVIENVLENAFSVILESYWYKEHVLYADKVVSKKLGITSDIETFKANRTEFYRQLSKHVGGLAVERLQTGAIYLGSLWYSAWLEAGKPSL